MSYTRARDREAEDLGFLDHQLYMTNRPLGRCLDEAEASSSNSTTTSGTPAVAGPSSFVAQTSATPFSSDDPDNNDHVEDEEDSSSTIRPAPSHASIRPLTGDEAARLMEGYQARRPATTNSDPVASVSAEPGRPIWAAQPATRKWRNAHKNHFPGPAARARQAASGETSASDHAVPQDTEFVATRHLTSFERYVAALEGRPAAGNPGNMDTLAAFQANLSRGAATPTLASSGREALLGLSAANRDLVEVGAA